MEQKKGHMGGMEADVSGFVGDEIRIVRLWEEPMLEFSLYSDNDDRNREKGFFAKIPCAASAAFAVDLIKVAVQEWQIRIKGHFETDTVYKEAKRKFVSVTTLIVEELTVLGTEQDPFPDDSMELTAEAQGVIRFISKVRRDEDGFPYCTFRFGYGSPIPGDDHYYFNCLVSGDEVKTVKELFEEARDRVYRIEGDVWEEKGDPYIVVHKMRPTGKKAFDFRVPPG